ncbi:hypothetical protein, partial [Thiohalocapsa halophila]|uniref:hypothetical protein n=1 Tax=Thiohalocapsa halophila TaxID=69359 RepID=UPI001A92A7AA
LISSMCSALRLLTGMLLESGIMGFGSISEKLREVSHISVYSKAEITLVPQPAEHEGDGKPRFPVPPDLRMLHAPFPSFPFDNRYLRWTGLDFNPVRA